MSGIELRATLEVVLAGGFCGALGFWVLSERLAYAGESLSHGMLPGLVLAGAALPDHTWSEEIRAFGAAEDEALEAGDLDRAAEVNVEFWVPAASEQVRAAIREQQRNAFVLQVGRDDEEELLTDDLPSRLATIDVPTLVLVGERDHADFEAIADRLVAELPRARRETIPGAGHLPSLEQPEAFDAAVLPFLATLR